MKKAINAWSVPGRTTFVEMFRELSDIGFQGVELNLDAENSSSHSLTMNSNDNLYFDIRMMAEKYQLEITSIASSLYGEKLGSSNPSVREEGKDILRKQLECAKELGTDSILVVPGGVGINDSMKKAYENSFNSLRELLPEIEAAKVNVCLENVGNNFFLSPYDMVKMIDDLNSKYIKAYFDVGNAKEISEPEHWIEILGDRICRVHAKDFKRISGRTGCNVNLFEGNVNWEKVVNSLENVGYDGYIIAEANCIEECPTMFYYLTSNIMDKIISKEK